MYASYILGEKRKNPSVFFYSLSPEHSLQCQESHEASHCDVNRCYGYRPRWMTGRVPGGRDLSRTLAPADWLCRNVTGYALFECSTVILRTEVS
ncbi:hypothetical protein TNIN_202261 [Trichonephila inaurata madagascariensis]|uniref:Uncharacterized protein n=1 Tax=Trichonephila inaurata madagascariensis TaxID=2747483 RepID=A0A8X6XGV8_9ARAC|nr:hypothetical protein TNIN_202261 [Trichonephila inaurata madagascariensis]